MKSGTSWEKKDKNCSLETKEDKCKGSQWDHVALDAESKLGISLVVGRRNIENITKLVHDYAQRTNHRIPHLITSDEYKPYPTAILEEYGQLIIPERTGKRGRPKKPYKVPPPELTYATVHKHRRKGKVVKITIQTIFGTIEQVKKALDKSKVSHHVNITFVERYHGTTRQLNARKQRKVYTFSKKLLYHELESWSRLTYYNFCRVHGGLRKKNKNGTFTNRTPAMAAGLTDHIWSLDELLSYPVPYEEIQTLQ